MGGARVHTAVLRAVAKGHIYVAIRYSHRQSPDVTLARCTYLARSSRIGGKLPAPLADGVVTLASRHDVPTTVALIEKAVREKGLTLFAVIDHSGEAARAGLSLPDTKLIIFGNARAGTPVMRAVPLAALDLPLKALVWADDGGKAWVSYNSPVYIRVRYGLAPELAANIAGIEPLLAAVAST